MPNYVRWRETGAAYFFTVVTFDRRPFLTSDTARACLREAWLGMRDDFLVPTVCENADVRGGRVCYNEGMKAGSLEDDIHRPC